MKLRTEIETRKLNFALDHSLRGVMLGSCFAQNISQKLSKAKFDVVCNPFGVLFNPASIALTINDLHSRREFTADDLSFAGGVWFSFAHHGSFSGEDKATVLENIRRSAECGARGLEMADYVVITLGTAWVYRLVESGQVVANCHKMPASSFVRERMSVEGIVETFAPLLEGALAGKQVVFTVSPIRHIADGLAENSVSKATLIVAANTLCDTYSNAEYFPSYEILMDDLRDYRFYDPDMVHPTDQSVDYVWKRFCDATMGVQTRQLLDKISAINSALAHRPINPHTEAHRVFLGSMLAKVTALQGQYPYLNFDEEKSYFGL